MLFRFQFVEDEGLESLRLGGSSELSVADFLEPRSINAIVGGRRTGAGDLDVAMHIGLDGSECYGSQHVCSHTCTGQWFSGQM